MPLYVQCLLISMSDYVNYLERIFMYSLARMQKMLYLCTVFMYLNYEDKTLY